MWPLPYQTEGMEYKIPLLDDTVIIIIVWFHVEGSLLLSATQAKNIHPQLLPLELSCPPFHPHCLLLTQQ